MRNLIQLAPNVLEFIGTAGRGIVLAVGQWICKITETSLTQSGSEYPDGETKEYSDRTLQLKTVFTHEESGKQITEWYNLNGFYKQAHLDASDKSYDPDFAKFISTVNATQVGRKAADWAKLSIEDKADVIFDFNNREGYAVANFTFGPLTKGKRMVSPRQTENARARVGEIWVKAGGKIGTTFNEHELVGLTIGVAVKNKNGKSAFSHVIPVEEVVVS